MEKINVCEITGTALRHHSSSKIDFKQK